MSENSVVVGTEELEEVAGGYRLYLLLERGLSDASVDCYEPTCARSEDAGRPGSSWEPQS